MRIYLREWALAYGMASRIYKAIVNQTTKQGYRPDLRREAVARASAIRQSQQPKKDLPEKKPRGAKAKNSQWKISNLSFQNAVLLQIETREIGQQEAFACLLHIGVIHLLFLPLFFFPPGGNSPNNLSPRSQISLSTSLIMAGLKLALMWYDVIGLRTFSSPENQSFLPFEVYLRPVFDSEQDVRKTGRHVRDVIGLAEIHQIMCPGWWEAVQHENQNSLIQIVSGLKKKNVTSDFGNPNTVGVRFRYITSSRFQLPRPRDWGGGGVRYLMEAKDEFISQPSPDFSHLSIDDEIQSSTCLFFFQRISVLVLSVWMSISSLEI